MADKVIGTRIKHKKDTSANWTSKNPVLLNGELIVVITDAGDTRFKIGDGTKAYTKLPFTDEPLYNALSDKVDKVDGMGLSANSFTTEEKELLAALDTEKMDDVAVTILDNGKFLRVVNGEWAAVTVSDVNENDEIDGVTLPDYWQVHINQRIEDIKDALSKAGWNKSAFLFYTDSHWSSSYNYKRSPAVLRYLSKNTPIKVINYGGDIVDNEISDPTDLVDVYEWRNLIKGLPHHSVVGNHDDGNEVDDRWEKEQIYAFLLADEETSDIVRGNGGLYYYRDNSPEKTRYLYLDSATKTGNIIYDTDQQNFLKEALKTTPDGWHIVAISHIWLNVDYDVTPPVPTGFSYGGQWMLDQFDAYNTREGEYADCNGTVEFCIGGHAHIDADYKSSTGIPVLLIECDGLHLRSGLTATEGTVSENSVNAIIADYKNSIINVIRFGRGDSRIVSIRPTYTNVLKTATDTDGSLYNGGTGYKDNVRWSTTSSAETNATGWDITGYIRATGNDVLRFANLSLIDPSASTARSSLFYFNEDYSYLDCSSSFTSPETMHSDFEVVTDASGEVVQMKVPSYIHGAYIRIVANDINENSIITVNEEITDNSNSGGTSTPSYTNQLPIATDASGAVYNGTGYKANTRVSSSSKTETAATGWYLTGFIPATRNDVIRIKNAQFMDMNDSIAGTDRASIYCFASDKSWLTVTDNYTPTNLMSDLWEAEYGEDGNVIKFKIPSNYDSTIAYIRIGFAYLDENSIITVNEVIE